VRNLAERLAAAAGAVCADKGRSPARLPYGIAAAPEGAAFSGAGQGESSV